MLFSLLGGLGRIDEHVFEDKQNLYCIMLELLLAEHQGQDGEAALQDCLGFFRAWEAKRFPSYVYFFLKNYKLTHASESFAGIVPEFVYLLFF